MTDQNSVPERSFDSDAIVASGSVSSQPSPDRRKLFRRLAALAGLGITGALLSQDKTGILPRVAATSTVTTPGGTQNTVPYFDTSSLSSDIASTSISYDPSVKAVTVSTNIAGVVVFIGENDAGSGDGVGVEGFTASPDIGTFPLVAKGVYGLHNSGPFPTGNGIGVSGESTSGSGYGVVGIAGTGTSVAGGTGVVGLAGNASANPLVAKGASGQTANLQEWQSASATPLLAVDPSGVVKVDSAGTNNGTFPSFLPMSPSIRFGVGVSGEGVSSNRTTAANGNVNGIDFWTDYLRRLSITNAGNVGIGTATPQTTLQVNGGMSVAMKTVTSSYTMTTSDFAILANASTGGLTVTLPAASNKGMLVFIKKIDTSTNVVTISRAGTDKIEGSVTQKLATKNKSLTLIADGTSTWYIQSSAA